MSLTGKVALVTGGARGIGRAICLELARRGASVAINYAGSAQAAQETLEAVEALGAQGMCIQADVKDSAACQAMVDEVIARFGHLDILVCNAGVTRDNLALRLKDEDYDAVLGTGHVSPAECFTVVEAARDAGVKKIVVTHPEWSLVGMSLEDQVRIVKDYQVVLEHCYAQPLGGGKYKSNLPDNVEAIRACGYRNVLVSTDGGQVENPHWELALAEYIQYLADAGIPEEQIGYMTRELPASLLGI